MVFKNSLWNYIYIQKLQELVATNPELGLLPVVVFDNPNTFIKIDSLHISKGFYGKEEKYFSDERFYVIDECNAILIENTEYG